MAMRKYTDVEKIEVFRGREANVLNDHFRKNGKYAVSDFTDEEKKALSDDLSAVKEDVVADEK